MTMHAHAQTLNDLETSHLSVKDKAAIMPNWDAAAGLCTYGEAVAVRNYRCYWELNFTIGFI